MKIKGWKIIHLPSKFPHITCPQRLKMKRVYYRILLFSGGIVIYVCHHYAPDYEIHAVVANIGMFAFDPYA